MPRNWTNAQKEAIEDLGKTLLVSAAAGSGKTATLTERIIRSVTDPNIKADLSRILVVTYTRAAAAELQSRISEALTAALAQDPTNTHLSTQSLRLSGAQISTVHSFCLSVIRENFADFGVSASIRVADSSEAKVLRCDVMQELIEECYSGECEEVGCDSEEFCYIADNLSDIQKTEALSDLLLSLYDKMESHSSPADQMKACAQSYVECAENYRENKFYNAMLSEIELELEHYEKRLNYVWEHFCCMPDSSAKLSEYFAHEISFASELRRAYNGGAEALRAVALSYSQPKPVNMSSASEEEKSFVYATRNGFKKFVLSIPSRINLILDGMSGDTAQRLSRIVFVVGEMFEAFSKRLWEEKLRRGICEFSDLERLMLEKLVQNGEKTEFARLVSEKFDYIYIDEYQDINPVQNAIFEAISKPDNCFMVGDVKQSIYSFQGGDPKIFASLRSIATDTRKTIYMSDNFRCDSTVIDFVNSIFEKLMPIGNPSFGYVPSEDNLVPSKYPMPNELKASQVVLISKSEDEDDGGDLDCEIEWVADEIARLVRTERKNDGSRITPGDIAILLGSVKNVAHKYSDALQRRGIASYTMAKSSLLSSPEVVIVTNLLSAIDNPYRDVALVGAMESPLFGFSMDELINIRRHGRANEPFYRSLVSYCEANPDYSRGNAFLQTLSEYREYSKAAPVDKLIRHIYQRSGIFAFADNKSKKGNLHLLYEAARSFESGSFKGLYNFIQYLAETTVNGGELGGAPSITSGLDAVSIVTMHSSKGLEYPVCFVSGCNGAMTNMHHKTNILYHSDMGVSMKILDRGGYVRYANPWYAEFEKTILRHDREERHRLLYVALTRARERLYVTAKVGKAEKLMAEMSAERRCPTRYSLLMQNSFIKAVLATASPDSYELVSEHYGAGSADVVQVSVEPRTPESDSDKASAMSAKMLEAIEYGYPRQAFTRLPAKLSVSKLSPNVLDLSDEGESTLSQLRLPKMKRLCDIADDGGASGAEIGTATHTFLQFCDFEAASKDIETEIGRLCENRFIPKRYAELISRKQLKTFFESDFYQRMSKSDELHREFRFNLKLPCEIFTQDDAQRALLSGEELLVQGVIDCFFEEEGEIVIVDYKTDHLTEEELANPEMAAQKLVRRHHTQLLYYAEACRRICRKPVRDVYIYSLPAGRAFSLAGTPMSLE